MFLYKRKAEKATKAKPKTEETTLTPKEGGGVEGGGVEGGGVVEGVPAVGVPEVGAAAVGPLGGGEEVGDEVGAATGAGGGGLAAHEMHVVLVGPANCPPW